MNNDLVIQQALAVLKRVYIYTAIAMIFFVLGFLGSAIYAFTLFVPLAFAYGPIALAGFLMPMLVGMIIGGCFAMAAKWNQDRAILIYGIDLIEDLRKKK